MEKGRSLSDTTKNYDRRNHREHEWGWYEWGWNEWWRRRRRRWRWGRRK